MDSSLVVKLIQNQTYNTSLRLLICRGGTYPHQLL